MSAAPNWDMTPYFPEFRGDDYRSFWSKLEADLTRLLDDARAAPPISEATLEGWAALLERLEEASNRMRHLGGYLGCMGSADGRDQAIQSDTARAEALGACLKKANVAIRARLRDVGDADFEKLVAHPSLADAGYHLQRQRQRALWSMDADLEALAADLGLTGIGAWGRLYDQVSGKLEFELERPGGKTERLPISMTRTLLEDADPEVRRAAQKGSNAAWERSADVVAASLNSISGTRLELYRRRGIEHFLDPAVFDAGITRKTLDTMLGVIRERAEVPRRYLRRKADLLGCERLGFHDLSAPLPFGSQRRISWDEGCAQILEAFGSVYPKLQEFAAEAFERNWIDYEPRPGKRPGGFCSTSQLIRESRIFCTYQGAPGDVITVAHELGHAFHSRLLRDDRLWACGYPMTLAETASTFAQNLVIEAALDAPDTTPQDRAVLLDGSLQDAAAFLLNIPMRFRFERAVYEERGEGELSVDRLCELMCEAQREWYGDALDPDALDPWFWASKLHFYIAGLSFYNFPYAFGYLFSTGIFARARAEGPSFLPRYEDLLRMTGRDTAENVARAALGVDLEAPDFWNASIDLIEADLERFQREVGALKGS